MSTKKEKDEGSLKVKKKPSMKNLTRKDKPIKVNLTKQKEENAIQEPEASSVDEVQSTGNIQEVEESVQQPSTEEAPVATEEKEVIEIEEITTEEPEVVTKTTEPVMVETPTDIPENVEKLINFMKDTGGDIKDYVNLNTDYTSLDNVRLLQEYYKKTKPHLDSEEINFIMEDKFLFDPDEDEQREIKKKKLAMKEELAKASNFLEDLKSKYYDEIKLRPGITQDQQKATEFFNRHNKEQEAIEQNLKIFRDTTKDYFTNDFKGFEFEVGEKRFKYNVKNTNDIADKQSNMSSFFKKFLDKDGKVTNYSGYHKAMYAARNVDNIASHFYEQGKADAIKNVVAETNNISTEPRATASGDVFINGLKVKAISGADSSKLKIKKRTFNT